MKESNGVQRRQHTFPRKKRYAYSQREYMAIKHQVCKELREKYTECYKDLTALELEICGPLKIRQSVYNRVKAPDLKPGDPQIII